MKQYSTVQEVREMLKDDVIDVLLGNIYIEDPEEREAKLTPLIESAIVDADGEIDGYLNARYPTPLATIPKVITKMSKDIALFNLISRIGIDEGERENVVLTRYKNAIRFLENVAKGLINIGIKTPDAPTHKPKMQSNNRLFSRESLRGM